MKSHPYLYAVYDDMGRIIQTYVSLTWAKRKASEFEGSRIEPYIHKGNKIGVEMAHYTNRETII